MEREPHPPRPDWQRRVEQEGLIWHSDRGIAYWDESAFYQFSTDEITVLEEATRTLYGLFLAAGDHIIAQGLFHTFNIPDWCIPLIINAWETEPPALNYGRFDLGYDGVNPPKLFEFNCDTPTALLEAAVIQADWQRDLFPNHSQFNRLHGLLRARWADLLPDLGNDTVYFTHADDWCGEDAVTTAYLMDLAQEAGHHTQRINIVDIGWNGRHFLDLDDKIIRQLYHLYPWEWLVREPFGRHITETDTRWIEPIWKMIWSNKAILPILWSLFPDHPNLLWADNAPPATGSYVEKPILSREGANIRIIGDGVIQAATGGTNQNQPMVYQSLYALPSFDGAYPIVGSWIVDGTPAGIGIREDGLITSNRARFRPHRIA